MTDWDPAPAVHRSRRRRSRACTHRIGICTDRLRFSLPAAPERNPSSCWQIQSCPWCAEGPNLNRTPLPRGWCQSEPGHPPGWATRPRSQWPASSWSQISLFVSRLRLQKRQWLKNTWYERQCHQYFKAPIFSKPLCVHFTPILWSRVGLIPIWEVTQLSHKGKRTPSEMDRLSLVKRASGRAKYLICGAQLKWESLYQKAGKKCC